MLVLQRQASCVALIILYIGRVRVVWDGVGHAQTAHGRDCT